MKIVSWNVNGIRAAVRNGFFDSVKKIKPDILCIQETKAHEDVIPDEVKDLKGYYFYNNSAQKKGYAGTAVLSKNPAKQVIDKIGVKKFDSEGRFLFLEFDKFYLFNTYFPHTQRELTRLEFKQEFNKAYIKFIKKYNDKPIILTGDFNVAHQEVDLTNPKSNERNAGFTIEERVFVDELNKNDYIDIYRELYPKKIQYTWWSYRFHARVRNIGWRIDYFFIPKKLKTKVLKVAILDKILGSDHCPVSLEIDIKA
jgi:exodeoxyribonuclease III